MQIEKFSVYLYVEEFPKNQRKKEKLSDVMLIPRLYMPLPYFPLNYSRILATRKEQGSLLLELYGTSIVKISFADLSDDFW